MKKQIIVCYDSSGELLVLWDTKKMKLYKHTDKELINFHKTGHGFCIKRLLSNNPHLVFVYR